MDKSKIVGNKIALARKKRKISQAQLAQRLFFSPQAVGKWERGESMPDIITFNRLAEILGVDLNYFSESYQSESIRDQIAPDEPLIRQSGELSPGKAGAKTSWDMSRGNWMDADFSCLINLHEKFSSSNMQGCRFNGSDLSQLLLKNNNVGSCDFSGSDISNSHIQSCNLGNNKFIDCSLKETEFSRCNIYMCDFSGVNLTGTEFSKSFVYGCEFKGADFTGVVIRSGGFSGVEVKSGNLVNNPMDNAVWDHTSFIDTQIADIIFTGRLVNCYFENCVFTRAIFRNATLINTFFKNNKKLKQIRFLDCSADRMTFEFLKQGKADLTSIKLLTN